MLGNTRWTNQVSKTTEHPSIRPRKAQALLGPLGSPEFDWFRTLIGASMKSPKAGAGGSRKP